MCGRVNVIDSPGLQALLRDLGIDLKLPSRANIAPTEPLPLVRQVEGKRTIEHARWWLTPSWAPAVDQKYAMFNARSEGLANSRAFRQPFRRQRGVVPVSSFLEWRSEEGGKQPWKISNSAQAFALAALWDIWDKGDTPLLSCTLVTTAADPVFQPWHQRMPVILDEHECTRWLDNTHQIAPDDPLFRPELKTAWQLQRLTREVSNGRNKDIALMTGNDAIVELAA